MRKETDVTVLDVVWEGPYSLEQVSAEFHGGPDYGIYQIYGTHGVQGSDTLLYIGRAKEKPFGHRIPAHKEWIDWEPGTTNVYLGRLGGTDQMTEAGGPNGKK